MMGPLRAHRRDAPSRRDRAMLPKLVRPILIVVRVAVLIVLLMVVIS